jgi:hypothetical protein
VRLSEYIPKTSQEGIDDKINQLADDIVRIYRTKRYSRPPSASSGKPDAWEWSVAKAMKTSTLGPESVKKARRLARQKMGGSGEPGLNEGADAAVYSMAELLVSQVHAGTSLKSAIEKLQKRSKVPMDTIQKAVKQAKEMMQVKEGDAPFTAKDSAEIDKMVQRIIYHVKKGRPFGMAVNRAFAMSRLPATAIHIAMDKAHDALSNKVK